MDINETSTETVEETTETSFGVELAKATAVGAASAAGTVIGMLAIGYVIGKAQKLIAARKARTVETTPETEDEN